MSSWGRVNDLVQLFFSHVVPSNRVATVGETVTSSSKAVCRTGTTAQVNQYGHPHQSMAHPFADGGNPTFNDNSGRRRRIRDSSSSLQLEIFSRDHVLNRGRKDLGLLSPPVSTNISHLPYHSLAPQMPNDNPFDAALQAIDDDRIRHGISDCSQWLPQHEKSNRFIQSPRNQPPFSFPSLAARLSTASSSSPFQCKLMTDWDAWSNDVYQSYTSRHQGLKLPPRSETRVTEAEGFSFNSPNVVQRDLAVQCPSNQMDAFDGASGNFSSQKPYPSKKRGSDSTDGSIPSTGSRKQLRLDSFALTDERNANRFSSFFLDVSAGKQEHMGGIARFKTRRIEETTPVYPPSRDLAGQTPFVTTLPSQRKELSSIDEERGSGNITCREPHPSRSLKHRSDSTDTSVSSRGGRKQLLKDGFGLNLDRNVNRFPSSVRDFSAGEQERIGGIARFKTRSIEETALVHPPSRDLTEQIPFVTTLSSQRKMLSVIDDNHLGPEPLCSLEKRGHQVPALRFFNNGIEVDINGRRIVDAKEASETTEGVSCSVDPRESPETLIRNVL